ncbi:hypothetical protein [Roseovarius bejariae]|uniref:hypothetical protein n=1 Tax=Roseovarius bejariae TaxID=2576383 RepID=UPI001561B014|nr:hypothetical protein [Roseovarius bejariae]
MISKSAGFFAKQFGEVLPRKFRNSLAKQALGNKKPPVWAASFSKIFEDWVYKSARL